MHAIIEKNKSIQQTLQYHELKVQKGAAECIYAANFIKDLPDLSRADKEYPFGLRRSLNDTITMNIFHPIINFHPEERLSNEKMVQVVGRYLIEMGFGEQPYLIYRHNDTHQPHCHVVSTTIRPDGGPFDLTKKDYCRSRQLTRQLEKEYSLRLTDRVTMNKELDEYPLQKIRFGVTPLRPAMNKVIETVVPKYLYTSLDELNAVLGIYNLRASRGKENSQTYRKNGLLFLPLMEDGREEGPYLKASSFRSRPTLNKLETRFAANQSVREPWRKRLTTSIDWALKSGALSLPAFKQAMAREGINVVIQPDKAGNSGGIWYIDQETKAVFDGITLGNQYTAEAIRQRTLSDEAYRQIQEKETQTERQRLRLHL